MKYLITGKGGQLARAFVGRMEERSADFLALGQADLDITDPRKIDEVCAEAGPDVIINCAAYNLVDRAEADPAEAFAVNATGPKLLARAARRQNAFLVHFGSDYVFDGGKNTPYTEADAPNPLNRYGESKLGGEAFIAEETDRFLILRLSWVFGEGEQNFIYKLMEWAKKGGPLRIADDEISAPTYTYTIADTVMKALGKGLSGLYHLAGSGYCSRFEWARFVTRTLELEKEITPVPMSAFRLPAKRPGFSAMSNASVSKALGISIPAWEEDVARFLNERLPR